MGGCGYVVGVCTNGILCGISGEHGDGVWVCGRGLHQWDPMGDLWWKWSGWLVMVAVSHDDDVEWTREASR